jgi:hypothetical protein
LEGPVANATATASITTAAVSTLVLPIPTIMELLVLLAMQGRFGIHNQIPVLVYATGDRFGAVLPFVVCAPLVSIGME